MRTSTKGLMEIISHEAIVLRPYRDVAGVWTIGIGHTAAAGPPDPALPGLELSLGDAIALFRRDLARYEDRVSRAFTVALAQHEFDAAVSFDFNTGGIDKADWVREFNAGQRDLAIEHIMNWRKPAAIIPRRAREQALFATGKYGSNGTAMLYEAKPDGKVDWSSGQRVRLKPLLLAQPTRKPVWQRILAWLTGK